MMSIDDPVALAVMEWLSPQAGGRRSGPPSWPYAATCDFLEEDMRHHPGRSESPGYTSLLCWSRPSSSRSSSGRSR